MPETSFSEAQRQKYLAAIERLKAVVDDRQKRVNENANRKYGPRPRLASYDVYDPTEDVLSVLQATPGLTIVQIGEILDLPRTRLRHWILKMLGKGLIQKVIYRDRYCCYRYYPAGFDTSNLPTDNRKLPTNAILAALKKGPKSLKQLRRVVEEGDRGLVSSCIEMLLKKKRITRVIRGVYCIGTETADPCQKILAVVEASPGLNLAELIAKGFGMHEQTVREYLTALAESGNIQKVIVKGSRVFFRYYPASYPVNPPLIENPGPTQAVLDFLQARKSGSIKQIWEATAIKEPVVRAVIQNLVKQGILTRVSKGVYSVREKQNDY